MTNSGDLTHTYNIYTPVEYISYTAFTQAHVPGTERVSSSVCGYTIDYSVAHRNYYDVVVPLPPFLVWDHSNLRFEI